jgi:hypothetical protein
LNIKRLAAAGLLLGVIAPLVRAAPANAQMVEGNVEVEPEAVELLQRTMDYLGGLEAFTVRVYNLREDIHESGDRVDYESFGDVTVMRPDKLRGFRHAEPLDEALYYDGSTVTFYNDVQNVYMSMAAPATIEEMFLAINDYVELYPVSDIIWQHAFPYLMQGVNLATVVGTEEIGGVTCTHLLFGRPDIGFQIWIPESGPPLPAKYIVTDYATPALLSIVTYISDWNTEPDVADDAFEFDPPAGAREMPFPKPDATGE